MIKVLILSHDSQLVNQVSDQLTWIVPDFKVQLALNPEEAAKLAEDTCYHVFFMDLPLAIGSQLALVESMRHSLTNRFLPIILIDRSGSEISEDQQAAYGLSTLAAPIKPNEFKALMEMLFLERIGRKHRSVPRIFIDQPGASRWIKEDDILFVNYAARRVVIHTKRESIEYKYMPLQKFASQLSSQFVQVHQSYVVNFAAVRSYNRKLNVLMLAGCTRTIPVGRSYQKSLLELFKNQI